MSSTPFVLYFTAGQFSWPHAARQVGVARQKIFAGLSEGDEEEFSGVITRRLLLLPSQPQSR
jgi:hypothetical protein